MPSQKAKTVDGLRTQVRDINIDLPRNLDERSQKPGILAAIIKGYKTLSEVMAGMYTGVGCSGTPHSHHSYDEEPQKIEPESKSEDSAMP